MAQHWQPSQPDRNSNAPTGKAPRDRYVHCPNPLLQSAIHVNKEFIFPVSSTNYRYTPLNLHYPRGTIWASRRSNVAQMANWLRSATPAAPLQNQEIARKWVRFVKTCRAVGLRPAAATGAPAANWLRSVKPRRAPAPLPNWLRNGFVCGNATHSYSEAYRRNWVRLVNPCLTAAPAGCRRWRCSNR